MSGFFVSLFAFLFAIAILIAFHEFGHFWVARRCGVRVLRFSLGFGKPLLRWKDKQNTEYVVAAIPLGGYVKMLDEREGPVEPQDRHLAFNRQPLWQRFLIVLAGPAFNFIFAVLAYWLMFMIGIKGFVPLVGEITPQSIADKAGLQQGDEIVMVDEQPVSTWQAMVTTLISRLGDEDTLVLEAKREGSFGAQKFYLDLERWDVSEQDPDLIKSLGIEPFIPAIPPVLDTVFSGEPAHMADLEPGDEIIGVNGQPISDWLALVDIIKANPEEILELKIRRDDEVLVRTVVPREMRDKTGARIGHIGVKVKPVELPEEYITLQRYGPLAAFQAALNKTAYYTVLTVKLLGKMITGKVSVHNLSGPISIAQGAGAMASIGVEYFLGFLALISVSLGVLNLLPIPVLDGGHLFYYLIEAITRKPVSERVQEIGFKIGMLLLLMLMTLAFYNDILRLTGLGG